MRRNTPFPGSHSGFSLVDIMVGMVIGLLAILAIMQSYGAFEGQKRTTTSGMEAQENGLIALQALETDVRQGGYGLTNNSMLACTSINTYDTTGGVGSSSSFPVRIIDDTDPNNTTHSDIIIPTYSESAVGGVPARIVFPMPSSSSVLTVNTDNGMNVNDIVLVSTPGSGQPCSRLQITQLQTQANGVNLIHNSGLSQYNPPNSTNLFPSGGYTTNPQAVVFDMGSMSQNQFQVLHGMLTSIDLVTNPKADFMLSPPPAGVGVPPACTTSISCNYSALKLISSNIVAIQAQYGIAPSGNQSVDCWVNATNGGNSCDNSVNWASPSATDVARIKAIRVAVVARSSLRERPNRTTGACDATTNNNPQWLGNATAPIDLSALGIPNWQCYRYKVYQTVIPLRNVLWANL